jgi:type I restriction enzyme, S subunit
MSYVPYPKYKNSGVEWLGEIPEWWGISKFPYCTSFKEGPGIMAEDFRDKGIPLVRVTNLIDGKVVPVWRNYLDPGKVVDKWSQFRLERGDLLISASASTGLIAEIDDESSGAIPYTGLIFFKPHVKRLRKDYLKCYFESLAFSSQIDVLKTGATISHYGPTHLSSMLLTLPPLQEQKAIAAFLDRETRKLDLLVEKQERLIELLKEKRQALISHCVTKGLNPNAKMKDSGVEWLGEIPERWSIEKLSYAVPKVTVGIVIKPSELYATEGIRALRGLNISKGSISTNELIRITEEGHRLNTKSKLSAGDIVLVRTGQIGIAAIVPPEFDNSNCIDLLVVKRSKNLESEFLLNFFWSDSFRGYAASQMVGAIQGHLNTSILAETRISIPPLLEQRVIFTFLNHETQKIDTLIEKNKSAITLLKERRTALISAAVTGKIDIRDQVSPEEIQ